MGFLGRKNKRHPTLTALHSYNTQSSMVHASKITANTSWRIVNRSKLGDRSWAVFKMQGKLQDGFKLLFGVSGGEKQGIQTGGFELSR